MTHPETLTVTELAKLWECHTKTAYRRMLDLERKYGTKVVGRRGRKRIMYTTREALRTICPDMLRAESLVVERISDLEGRMRLVEDRLYWLEGHAGDF